MLLLTLERGVSIEPLNKLFYLLDKEFTVEDAVAILDLAKYPRPLGDVWNQVKGADNVDGDRDLFMEVMEHVVGDVTFCKDCEEIAWRDDCTWIDDGHVCDSSCLDSYTCCDGCSEWVDRYDIVDVDSTSYCEDCVSHYCSWCDECDMYYDNDNSDEHEHNDSCDCEAPRPKFTFPANGNGTVRQNERLRVTLPSGTISKEGVQEIKYAVTGSNLHPDGHDWLFVDTIHNIDPTWQKKDGNYTRRLSKALYKEHNVKVPPALLSEIGNIARRHTSTTNSFHVEFTRDLNGSAEDFYHDDSCWWSSHAYSRCAFKSWGGVGLRSFENDNIDYPNGRAWVQPLDSDMRPTHDTANAFAYMVYNGYGKLDGYNAVRIVAHLTGRTYRKIPLSFQPQFVNGDMGYLVADEATCKATDSVSFYADSHEIVGNTVHVPVTIINIEIPQEVSA